MSTVQVRHGNLAASLLRKTQNKELVWKLDDWTKKLTTSVAGYQIGLERAENEDNEPIVLISVRSQGETLIDSFSDTDLAGIKPKDRNYLTYWSIMDELQRTAYRQAVGADEALDKLLFELDDDVPF